MSVYCADLVDVARRHDLGDDRHAGFLACRGEDLEATASQPAELVGRGARLVGAAAQNRRAGRLDRPRRADSLLFALDRAGTGDDRHGVATDYDVADRDGGLLRVEVPAGELVLLGDAHHALDPRVDLELSSSVGGSGEPTMPMMVRSSPSERCAPRPSALTRATMPLTCSRVAFVSMTMIIALLLTGLAVQPVARVYAFVSGVAVMRPRICASCASSYAHSGRSAPAARR